MRSSPLMTKGKGYAKFLLEQQGGGLGTTPNVFPKILQILDQSCLAVEKLYLLGNN